MKRSTESGQKNKNVVCTPVQPKLNRKFVLQFSDRLLKIEIFYSLPWRRQYPQNACSENQSGATPNLA